VKCIVFLLFVASFAVCQNSQPETISTNAIEGAKLLHSGMRDPDSFKIDKVWIMHSEKHGDAICYTYYAKNGFGGMNHSAADYAPNKKGKYLLNLASDDYDGPTGNINAIFPGGFEYFSRCGQRAIKADKLAKDLTEEVKKALADETASAPK
jgi:hypothetical protein